MDKLNLKFTPAQILKAELMNIIAGKIDELVDSANDMPAMDAAIKENKILIQGIKDSEVDISQAEFDALLESGELDETKTYYIYEE